MPSAARRAATQLMPGQYSRGPPVTKAQRGEPSLAAREAGTAGASCEETEGIGRARSQESVVRARHERGSDTGGKTDVLCDN